MTATATLKVENVDRFLWDLSREQEISLDLEEVKSIERPAGLMLSTALVGALGRKKVVVKASPRSCGRISQSGIAFALEHRPGHVVYNGIDGNAFRSWRWTWIPGSRATYEQELFRQSELFVDEEDESGLFGPSHAAFVNAHLAGTKGAQTAVSRAVPRWLHKLLPSGIRDGQSVSRIVRVLDELIDNVREHARLRPDRTPTKSLVQVARTRGTPDRLYVSVIDNGPGIVATLKPKIQDRGMSDHQMLEALLKGELEPWERGRGVGFDAVRRVVHEEGDFATLFVFTGSQRFEMSVNGIRGSESGYPIEGTVIVAAFRLQETSPGQRATNRSDAP